MLIFCQLYNINYMHSTNILLGAVIIFVILLVWSIRSIESSLLTGFWKADARFTQESGLITMIIYLGEPSIVGTRKGYIIAANDAGLILNNPINISFGGGYSLSPFMCTYKEYDINIDWIDEDQPSYFPSRQTLYFYPNLGKLILAHGTEIKAILYKDGSLMDTNSEAPKKLMDTTDNILDGADIIDC